MIKLRDLQKEGQRLYALHSIQITVREDICYGEE